MIHTLKILFCENEHGTGDVTFPCIDDLTCVEIVDAPMTVKALRSEAKKVGWTRHNGADYCPGCSESL